MNDDIVTTETKVFKAWALYHADGSLASITRSQYAVASWVDWDDGRQTASEVVVMKATEFRKLQDAVLGAKALL